MKNVAKSMLAAAVSAFAVPLQARLEVSSDGAIKEGDPGKTQNVSGNALDIAVERMYVYPTANKSGSFIIYNHTVSGRS